MSETFASMAPDGVLPLIDRSFSGSDLGEIRHEVTRCGSASGLSEVALAHFVVAVNEITTNAVRHAGGHGQLRLWQVDDAFVCEIVDKGPGISRRQLNETGERRPGRIGGHGLWLARHICDDVEIETGRNTGTRVLLRYVLSTPT